MGHYSKGARWPSGLRAPVRPGGAHRLIDPVLAPVPARVTLLARAETYSRFWLAVGPHLNRMIGSYSAPGAATPSGRLPLVNGVVLALVVVAIAAPICSVVWITKTSVDVRVRGYIAFLFFAATCGYVALIFSTGAFAAMNGPLRLLIDAAPEGASGRIAERPHLSAPVVECCQPE